MKLKMLVVQGRPVGKALQFPVGEYYFGRGKECHVRPNSEWVSRQHCLLRVTSSGAFLRDLGSRNGTLVNGVLLNEELPLRHGDQVQVGQLVFEIQLDSESRTHKGKGDVATAVELSTPDRPEAPTETIAALESTENLPVVPIEPEPSPERQSRSS